MKRKWIPFAALGIVAVVCLSIGLVPLFQKNGGKKPSGPQVSAGFEFEEVDGGYAVVNYAGTDVEVVLPEQYNGKPVISIGTDGMRANGEQDGFYGNQKIVTVHLPKSVKTIWKMAFADCPALTEVTGGEGLITLHEGAFKNCTALTSVSLGKKLETVGDSAFSECRKLETISLPDTVKTVASSAFFRCNALKQTVEGGVKFVGNEKNPYLVAYLAESSEITSAVIPDSTKIISDLAFLLCKKLTSVTVGSGVQFVGQDAFLTCDALTYHTEGGVDYLGNPSNPCVIAMKVAAGAEKDVALNENCRILYNGFTFQQTETFSINKNLLYVPENTLGGNGLTAYAVSEENAALKAVDGVLYSKDGKTLISYPSKKADTSFTVPETVTTIAEKAFLSAGNLTEITLSESVTTIGKSAFLAAFRLATIIFPVATGWSENGSPIAESTLADAAGIASYLKDNFTAGTWTRE